MKRHENIDIDNGLELLTVGQHTYTSEKRFTMDFQYPNNWRLKITNATKSDEGLYECQVSTHPPKVIQVNLHVNGKLILLGGAFIFTLTGYILTVSKWFHIYRLILEILFVVM